MSSQSPISTGAPQGRVGSSVLCTLYTHERMRDHPENYITKLSDDTAILGLMYRDIISLLLREIGAMV